VGRGFAQRTVARRDDGAVDYGFAQLTGAGRDDRGEDEAVGFGQLMGDAADERRGKLVDVPEEPKRHCRPESDLVN